MSRQKKGMYLIGIHILIIGLICLFTNIMLASVYMEKQYKTMSDLTDWMLGEYPDDAQNIMKYIKEYDVEQETVGSKYLNEYGFHKNKFWKLYKGMAIASSVFGVIFLVILSALLYCFIRTKKRHRIQEMTDYLTKANLGKEITILSSVEDEFSRLEDEIYKTVTEMRTTKEIALNERKNFAESLANIAHQIKTPITSMSVTVQMLQGKKQGNQLIEETDALKLKKQIGRINQLTDSLLIISKIDAGILELKKNKVDIYTLLVLSVEALENQINEKQIQLILPNHPNVYYYGDLNWSVEAFINLIKNSIEHISEEGTICFEYEKNPLYIEITIQDNGIGFDEKELPYIFKRFYQGKQKSKSGAGIGLSMAKSIIEMQNGLITAKNLKSGGACFSVRFYCH